MKTPSNPVKTARDQFAQTRTLNSSFSNPKFKHPPTNNQTHLVDFGGDEDEFIKKELENTFVYFLHIWQNSATNLSSTSAPT